MELDYTPSGEGNAALATGIIGTGLGAMNLLGNLGNFWGLNKATTTQPTGENGEFITRNEMSTVLDYEKQLAEKNMEISNLNSEKISDQKDIEVYRQLRSEMTTMKTALDSQIATINSNLNAQAVQNQANKDSFQILQERMDNNVSTLDGAISREIATRKANDNLIVTYANSTFTPKVVMTTTFSGATVGSSSAAQDTYNPLPACDCNN